MKQAILILLLFCTQKNYSQIVTYNILSTGLVNMRAIGPSEDFCFDGDYKQITSGSVWGINWTSTESNDVSSVTVEMMFTYEEANGPYDVTLNGIPVTTFNPPAINCGYSVQTYTFSPSSYNSGGLNELRFDYSPGGATHFMNYALWWGGFYYARVIVTYDAPLPVEILNFNSKLKNQNQVQLKWQTASENKNAGFEMQRSIDGRDWENFGFLEGKGDSDVLNDYQFIDDQPFEGVNYYRLKQIDYDGAFEFSKVVSVNFLGANNIRVYPNPTNGQINIAGMDSGNLKVMDRFGRLVNEEAFQQSKIDISELPSGIYFIQITSADDKNYTQKIFKE